MLHSYSDRPVAASTFADMTASVAEWSLDMLVSSGVTQHTLLTMMSEAATTVNQRGQQTTLEALKWRARAILYGPYNTVTPYGQIGNCLRIAGQQQTHLDLWYANPFALLHAACEATPAYGSFLEKYVVGGMCHICLYLDGVTPGNKLRPEKSRSYVAIYWCFLESPDWHKRCERTGWIPFGFALCEQMDTSGVKESQIVKAVMNVFWDDTEGAHNFQHTGLQFHTMSGRGHLRAEFGCFLGDDLAHFDILDHKGASAYKPCPVCLNLIGRVNPEEVADGMVHLKDGNPLSESCHFHGSSGCH